MGQRERFPWRAQACAWHILDDAHWMEVAGPLDPCLAQSLALSCLGEHVLQQIGSLQMDQVLMKLTTRGVC